MPRVNIPITQTDSTITRSVARSVVKELLHLTGIGGRPITYKQRTNQQINFTTADELKPLVLDSQNMLVVEYNEVLDPEQLNPSRARVPYGPIMSAPAYGIRLSPYHSETVMDLTITLRDTNYNSLIEWLAKLNLQSQIKSGSNLHDLEYNYNIPLSIVAYVNSMYTACTTKDSIGLSPVEFMDRYFNPGVVVRRNVDGSARSLAISVTNLSALGSFINIPDTASTEKEGSYSEVVISYRLTYAKPTSIELFFQPFVHNQFINTDGLLPHAVRTPVQAPDTVNPPAHLQTLDQYPNKALDVPNSVFLLNVDKWYPTTPTPHTNSIVISPFQISDTIPSLLLNLTDLLGTNLDQDMLDLILRAEMDVVNVYASPILVEVFAVSDITKIVPITVSPTLDVETTVAIDLRARYYIRVSLVNDLSQVSLHNLMYSPTDLLQVVRYLDPTINMLVQPRPKPTNLDGRTLYTVGGNSKVTPDSLIAVIKHIRTTNSNYIKHHGLHRMYLVNHINVNSQPIGVE